MFSVEEAKKFVRRVLWSDSHAGLADKLLQCGRVLADELDKKESTVEFTMGCGKTYDPRRIPTITEKLHDLVNSLIYENERLKAELHAIRFRDAMEKKPVEPKVQEKEAKGYKMTSLIGVEDSGCVIGHLFQDGRRVFSSRGFRSKEHAERILQQLMVEYALVEMPTL